MANTVNINIRMDEELKKEAEQLFADLGMNMTTAINVFVRQAVNHGGIPFDIVRKEKNHLNGDGNAYMQSIRQLESDMGMVHELIEDKYE